MKVIVNRLVNAFDRMGRGLQ